MTEGKLKKCVYKRIALLEHEKYLFLKGEERRFLIG